MCKTFDCMPLGGSCSSCDRAPRDALAAAARWLCTRARSLRPLVFPETWPGLAGGGLLGCNGSTSFVVAEALAVIEFIGPRVDGETTMQRATSEHLDQRRLRFEQPRGHHSPEAMRPCSGRLDEDRNERLLRFEQPRGHPRRARASRVALLTQRSVAAHPSEGVA